MHHSSTSIYTCNVTEIEETYCGQTDVRTDILDTLLGRLGGVDLKISYVQNLVQGSK